jgi:hypothetical protein
MNIIICVLKMLIQEVILYLTSTLNTVKLYTGVSEFHRQTFRANSMIKNKHKTLNTYGVKHA